MPLEIIIPSAFQHGHEQEMFDLLAQSLRSSIGSSSDTYFLVGNLHVGGRELDALFIGPGNLTVIEMKSHGGRVRFSENGPWLINGDQLRESADGNPFRQVRNYRFFLCDHLGRKSAFYRGSEWKRISALVLFGRPITLDNNIPRELQPWFQIKDLNTAAAALLAARDPAILKSATEIEQLRSVLDLDRVRSAPPLAEPASYKFEVSHIRQSEFGAAISAMRTSGMELAAAVRVITERIESVKKLPLRNPFSGLPSRIPKEIAGSVAYAINEQVELVCLQEGRNKLFPVFAGPNELVLEWLTRNSGLTLVLDGSDYRLSLTLATAPTTPPPTLPPATFTERTEPYLAALACPELEASLPGGFLRKALLGLTPTNSNEEIDEVLASLPEDTGAFFRDLFRLLRAGDMEGARARLGLRSGTSVIASDAPSALDEAVGAASNSDQVIVLSDLSPEEMTRILDLDRFQEWMYFLHPDQKQYVEKAYEKPVVLTGVSGSGKTCILVHRARYLARKHPDERIGIFTLNRNLAGLLRDLIEKLLTPEERKNVFVYAFYDYFSELLHQLGVDEYLNRLIRVAGEHSHLAISARKILSGQRKSEIARDVDARSQETIEDTWENFLELNDPDFLDLLRPIKSLFTREGIDLDRYLREEFTLIRSMWPPELRDKQYPGFDRSEFSRVVPFGQDIRYITLRLLLRYEEFMLEGGMLDVLSLTHALLPLRQKIRSLPEEKRFRYVLIDEFQDFSNLDLVILREICTRSAQDGFFMAGDLVQKILVKKLVLRDAGFDSTASHWLKIRKNFRNSRQILTAAAHLAKTYGEMAKAKKEEMEVLNPELTVRETALPCALKTDHPIDKAWEIALRMVGVEHKAPWTICIATANNHAISTKKLMDRRPVNLSAQILSPDWIKNRDHVVVCEVNELKGFEFHLVVIVGLENRNFPEPGVPEDEMWRDALRLYVAMTRARDELYLLFKQTPSVFLETMRPHLAWREENASIDLGKRHGDAPIAGPRKAAVPYSTWIISDAQSCFEWFSPMQVRHLREYFLRNVEGISSLPESGSKERNLLEHQKDGIFKIWLTPQSLSHVTYRALSDLNAARVLAGEIQEVLRSHGHELGGAISKRPPKDSHA